MTKTALPTKERRFAYQFESFCFPRSKTKLKSLAEGPECLMGMPRYFPIFGVDWKPKILHRETLMSLSTFGENYTLDFTSLTICPNRSQNSFNTSRTMVQFAWSALANSTKSSAKKRCENANPPLADFTGF